MRECRQAAAPGGTAHVGASEEEVVEQLQAFLARQLGAERPFRIENVVRIAVGRSRENWLFDLVRPDAAGEIREELIVRRDPPGGLLETDRALEFALLRALEDSTVPAPHARWLDAEGAWLGSPSLVMRREPGICDYFVLNGDRPLDERVALAKRFCDLLVAVHAVDWRGAGIGDLLEDPGESAALAELERWEAILRRDQLEAYPELELAHAWLRAHAPRSPGTVLVHGDFKPGNVLLLANDEIGALLDWELAHLGDPWEDLGWVTQPLRTREHLVPGAWEREDLFDRYQRVTGLEVDGGAVAWWNVFACYKTAVMQVTGLRSFVERRCDEPYRPTAPVLRTLLDLTENEEGRAHASQYR
jgi:aminoglycoside phosphotransferase (APT) family kinase protein